MSDDPMNPSVESLARRLERLEGENRQLKRWGAALLVALAAGLLLGARRQAPKIVEAEQFVVRDGLGKVRGRFGLQPFQVGLYLYDPDGKTRLAAFDKFEAGTRLECSDSQSQVRSLIGVTDQGRPTLGFNGTGGGTIALMRENGARGGELLLYGHRSTPAGRAADAGVYVLGTGGDVVLRSRLNNGAPEATTQINSPAGSRTKATLTVTPASGALRFFDVQGRVTHAVP
jgi:hypothetical protein